MSALSGEYGEIVTCVFKYCLSTDSLGRDHADLLFDEFKRKIVFFFDGLVVPTPWTIKLGYVETFILGLRLIDPVFITVKCQQAAVRPESY